MNSSRERERTNRIKSQRRIRITYNSKTLSIIIMPLTTIAQQQRVVGCSIRRCGCNGQREVVVVARNHDKRKHLPVAPSGTLATIRGMSGSHAPFFLLRLAHQMKRFSFGIRLPIPGGVYMIADHELALEIFKDATTTDKPPMFYRTFNVITGSSSIVFFSE